jgi:hypothetical protein
MAKSSKQAELPADSAAQIMAALNYLMNEAKRAGLYDLADQSGDAVTAAFEEARGRARLKN